MSHVAVLALIGLITATHAPTSLAQVAHGTDPATLPGPGDDLTGTEYGRALIFLDGPFDFDAMHAAGDLSTPIYNTPTEVLLTNLGEYDATGARVDTNGGALTGLYGEVRAQSFVDSLPQPGSINAADNDFRVNPFGDANAATRDAIIWSSQAHLYYFINEYRTNYLNDTFIDSLHLPAQLATNIKHLQYRPDLNLNGSGDPAPLHKPVFMAEEHDSLVRGLLLFPSENAYVVPLQSRDANVNVTPDFLPGNQVAPLSHAFDREAVIEDYAGLAAFWIIGTEHGFPSESGFGTTDGWITDIRPVLNDGLSAWVQYRVSGLEETLRPFYYGQRISSGQVYGDLTVSGRPSIAYDQGVSVRNVMMFDEQDFSRNSVFPYNRPTFRPGQSPAGRGADGPTGSDLAALFIGAIYYDIAHETGLGVHKADQLIWKTLSLIDEDLDDNFTMRTYAARIQEAARQLWPSPTNPSVSLYGADIDGVLTSRGIPVNGVPNFRDNLPSSAGASRRGFMFESGHPNSHPNVSSYDVFFGFIDEFTLDHPTNAEYLAITFSEHSKYGPADYLDLIVPDEEFDELNPTGTIVWRGEDRFGNMTVLVPTHELSPNTVRYLTRRERAATETEGYYPEDVRPFGFIATQVTANGFSFIVEELDHTGDDLSHAFETSGELLGTKTYRTTIVDPSLDLIGDADYFWTITDYLGNEQTGAGLDFEFTLALDQPFTIEIDRLRDGITDNLTLRERVNDFARGFGQAFVYDAVTGPIFGGITGDGFVGAEDLDILLANWGDSVGGNATSLGDLSGDGIVGQADLDIVLSAWGNGTPPGGTVPEPGTLAGLAVLLLCTSRRRRR